MIIINMAITNRFYSKFIYRLLIILFFFSVCSVFFTTQSYAISFDTTFGVNGKVITSFGYEANPGKIVLQSDGKSIVVGHTQNGTNRDWVIARYNTNGGLDSTFGGIGIVKKDFGIDGQQNGHGDFLSSAAIQIDGKIIVGGSSAINPTVSRWTLARYNTDGSLDPAFGDNGVVVTSIKSGAVIEYVNSLLIQSDNKIVAVGVSHVSDTDVALARYNPNGSPDTNFGTSGIVTTPIGSNNDRGKAAAIQPNDGKIVVAGDFDAGGHDEIFLARFNTDGLLDSSFSGGKVITQIGGYDGLSSVDIQADGKIVVAGSTLNASRDTFVARYNSDGTLDTSFGGTGKVVHSFSSGADGATSLILQSDGKIILGGYENTGVSSGNDFMLSRFNSDGTLDTTFGANGSFVTPIGSGDDIIYSFAQQTDGKIIGAGSVSNGSYNDWGLARYRLSSVFVPLLKQGTLPFNGVDPTWEIEEYAHPNNDSLWCGTTIADCGCAITSIAMLLRRYEIKNPTDGTSSTPATVNDFFNRDAQCGNAGCASLGYSFGDVRWGAVNKYAAEAFKNYGTQKIIYNGGGSYNETTVKGDVDTEKPVILGVPNHWVIATESAGNTFRINDPLFNQTLLSDSAYNNTATQGMRRFVTTNSDFSSIEIAVKTPAQIIITAPDGKKTGYDSSSLSNIVEIPSSEYFFDEAYTKGADPASTPPPDTGVHWAMIQTPQKGNYRVEVIGTVGQMYNFAAYISDRSSNTYFKLKDVLQSDEPAVYFIKYDPDAVSPLFITKGIT